MVFQKRTSLVFKKLQVVRFYDAKRNALVYLTYSDKVVDGSPKNAISACADSCHGINKRERACSSHGFG